MFEVQTLALPGVAVVAVKMVVEVVQVS